MKKTVKTLLSIFATLVFCSSFAFADSLLPTPLAIDPGDLIYGMTYGDWSAVWWQYIVSTPRTDNPLYGADCSSRQSGPVFFLVGSADGSTVTRSCTMPKGKILFAPIINAEISEGEIASGQPNDEYALRVAATAVADCFIPSSLKVTVDGIPLQNLRRLRVQSPAFTFNVVDSSILGIGYTGPKKSSVADGYWFALNPLPTGNHTIHFEGTYFDGTNKSTQNVTYHLTVK